jgi:hypothetical protein
LRVTVASAKAGTSRTTVAANCIHSSLAKPPNGEKSGDCENDHLGHEQGRVDAHEYEQRLRAEKLLPRIRARDPELALANERLLVDKLRDQKPPADHQKAADEISAHRSA